MPGKCQCATAGLDSGIALMRPRSGEIEIELMFCRRCQGWIKGSAKLRTRRARQYGRSTRGWRIWRSRGNNPAASTSRSTCALQNTRLENHNGMFIGDSESPQSLQELSFYFLDHAHNCLQILVANLTRFDEMDEERFGRTVENAINKFADHTADDLIFWMRRAVDE